MAPKSPDPAKQINEQMTDRTQAAMGNYLNWLQNAVSASPWTNTELNKKLLSYATETVSAYVELTQRLSQAKNLEDAATVQTEFVKAQMDLFSRRAKELGEIYTKVVTAAATRPFGMSS